MGLVEGKVIIVTGASSGIGEKTAEVLAAEGAKGCSCCPQKRKAGRCGKSYYAAGGEAYTSVVMSVSEKIATELQRKQ